MDQITVRRATPDNAPHIASIVAEMFGERFPADDLARWARHVLATADESTHLAVAAAAGGEVVGFAHWVTVHPLLALGPSVYLLEMFISSAHRDRGIGSLLLEYVHAHGEKLGAVRVELLNHRDRESYKRGFYRRHGYAEHDALAVFRRSLP